jgi:hypothetical protein
MSFPRRRESSVFDVIPAQAGIQRLSRVGLALADPRLIGSKNGDTFSE